VNEPLVIGPASPARMATLAACLALSGITVTPDSGDPSGCNYLIEDRGGFVALATAAGGELRILILHDPECAWISQIKPVICRCLGANLHRARAAHA